MFGLLFKNIKIFSLFKISNSLSTNFLQEVFSRMKMDIIIITYVPSIDNYVPRFSRQYNKDMLRRICVQKRERRDENEDCENIAYVIVTLALKAIVDWNATSRKRLVTFYV